MRKISLIGQMAVVLLAVLGASLAPAMRPQAARAAGTPEVVLNELMWGGSSASGSDEWIELYNTTNSPIDIAGWTLTNSATSGADLVLPTSTPQLIGAHDYYLISNFTDTSASSVLSVAPDWVTSSIALSNTCAPILLKDASTVTIDQMGCDGSNYFGGSAGTPKSSLSRIIGFADGLLAASWQSAVASANIDLSAQANNLATPKLANDVTAPDAALAVVNDGALNDIQFSNDTANLDANWSGFIDNETGIASYQVGLGTTPTTADVVSFASTAGTDTSFGGLSLAENTTYYVLVKATNGVGLTSPIVASNGVTINTLAPAAPTNPAATDVANDNGGSIAVSWTASPSPDVTGYQINYRVVGSSTWNFQTVGNVTNATISGLQNGLNYEFTIQAIDFSNLLSVETTTAAASPSDNIAPTVDNSKIILAQNPAGSNDTLSGQAGAINEPGALVTVYDRDPSLAGAVIIGTATVNADGSFGPINIGDNQYATVWVRVTDPSGNMTAAWQLTNTIAVPVAPPTAPATPAQTKPSVAKRIVSAVIPQAHAEEVTPAPSATDTTAPAPVTPDTSSASGQEWLRIVIVVILLLVVAGGFYALSRSFADDDDTPTGKPTSKPAVRPTAPPTKRGRGRPKGAANKSKPTDTASNKRGRGRPRRSA